MAISKTLPTKHWPALLAMLFVIVLIAHLAIITSAKQKFGTSTVTSKSTEAFTTRMVEWSPPVAAVEHPSESRPPSVQAPQPAKPKLTTSSFALPPPTSSPIEPAAQTAPMPTPIPAPTKAVVATEPMPLAVATAPAVASTSGESNQPAPAFVALDSGLHTYKVYFTKNGISNQGSAEVLWQQDGEKYALNMLAKYTLLVKTFNVFELNSTGLLASTGLQPKRFSDKRLNRSEVAAHFDYLTEKITFSANRPEVALQTGAQDRVSVIWQLAGLLAAQPARYPPGSTLTLQTVNSSDAEPWLFTVNEPETLNLPTGSHIALRLTRSPRREFDQKIELWFATDLNYLPVRFRFTETNNDYVDAVWQSIQLLPKTAP